MTIHPLILVGAVLAVLGAGLAFLLGPKLAARPAVAGRQPLPIAFFRAIGVTEIVVGLILVAVGYLNS